MKKTIIVLISCVLFPAAMFAGLISVEGLKADLSNPKLVILDVRGGKVPLTEFANGHIPNSQFVPFSDVAIKKGSLEVELPDPKVFEAAMQKVGVNNDSKVVIVSDGKAANTFAFGARFYWTMKNFGFKDVNLLNGGFASWDKAKEKVALGSPVAVEKKGDFKAHVGAKLPYFADKEDVKKALLENKTVIDCRSIDFYLGLDEKPGWKQLGHIDGAKFAYYGLLFKPKTTEYLSKEALIAYFANLKIDLTGELINYCGDGYGATDTWFALSEILGKKARIYDASMNEWDGPVSNKLQN